MGAMQNYVMHCDVRSWRASGVMFDKMHSDRRSNNDWQDPLLVLVDEYLVDFLLKDKGVVEHCLRSCPGQVQEVERETFTSRSWSKGEWTDGKDTCVCSGGVLFSAGSKGPLSRECDHELRPGDLTNLIIRPLLLVTRVSSPWNVQTVVCLSPNFLPVQRIHSNLPLLPPFFFWSIFSFSLSLLPSSFFYSSVPRLPHSCRKHIQ